MSNNNNNNTTLPSFAGGYASCGSVGGGCGASRKLCRPKHDIFAYNPNYEWTSHKTIVGMVLSYITIAFLVFYIAITTRDYIARPPELVSQGDIDLLQVVREIPFEIPKTGLVLAYTNTTSGDGNRVAALQNENPFVRFTFQHVIMRDQRRVQVTELNYTECIVSNVRSLCPVTDNYRLQGIYYKTEYHFLEILINKCVGETTCASLDEINQKIQSGEFRIRAQVNIEGTQFDVERFHATGKGEAINNRSYDFYGLPGMEIHGDIKMKARQIQKEQRYAGSPPMPETEINVLTLHNRETNFLPRTDNEVNLMTFVIKLDDNVSLEEVSYWCPSILDLFGLWGAMASFATALSLGFIAFQYNKWHFHKHLIYATQQKRKDAQQQTMATMKWLRSTGGGLGGNSANMEDIYRNLQAQYDALMVEPDIRLFETHHFDNEGRMAMTAAELKHPSTAFGELRRLAILEHSKKRRAARFLSVWYGRHLIKKGFIKDEHRRRELFASPDDEHHFTSNGNAMMDFGNSASSSSSSRRDGYRKNQRSNNGRFSLQSLRKRKSSASSSSISSSVNTNDGTAVVFNVNTKKTDADNDTKLERMERGYGSSVQDNDDKQVGSPRKVVIEDTTSSQSSSSHDISPIISDPNNDAADVEKKPTTPQQQKERAREVIAEMDLMTIPND